MNNWDWMIGSPLVPALGWAILHSLWQVALLGVLAFCGLKILSIQKAQARYLFSYGVLLVIGGLFIWNFNHQYQIASNKSVEVALHSGINEIPVIEDSQSFSLGVEKDQMLAGEQASEPIVDKKSLFVQLAEILSASKPFLTKSLPWLAMIWIFGVLFFGTRLIASWWYLKHWTRKAAFSVGMDWQNKLEKLKTQLGIQTAIRFLESSKISEPITFGWLKPVIMIPLGMLAQLPPDQVEAVLLHELAHIRRFDFVANLLQSFIEILLFFHPVVWWLSRKIRESREDCCDDIAATFCGNRHHYATSLIQVQKYSLTFKNQLAMAATGNSGRLTARIQRLFINTQTKNQSTRKQISPLLSLLLIFSFLSLYAFTDVFSFGKKTVSIAADKMNVFYIGVDNPITAAVAGISTEKIRLSSDDVNIEAQGDGHYLVRADKTGKATISVSGEGLETTDIEFRVKRLADPIAVLNTPGNKSSGGKMKAEEFKKAKGVSLNFRNFVFEVDIQVVGYTITRVGKQEDPVDAIVRQGDFSEKAKALVDLAQPGDIYYFDNVKVYSKAYSDNEAQINLESVNSMVFKMK